MDERRGESPTRRTLRRQLLALESLQYKIGVFDRNRMTRRRWALDKVLASVGWLAYRNVKGGHIYVRPAGTEFVLVDDATEAALKAMGGDGLAAAAVVETSPGNHQAWLRFERPLGRELATGMAQVLAARYGCNPGGGLQAPGSRGGVHQPEEEIRGRRRALSLGATRRRHGGLHGRAKSLRRDALEWIAKKERARRRRFEEANGAEGGPAPPGESAGMFFVREVQRIHGRYGSATDASRADAAAARRMAMAGFSESQVVRAMEGSRSVAERKAGHVSDYARRTARWAFGKSRFVAR